ncbi:Tn7-like element transposition protein TnsE [Acinetobacter baumannii]|nr:Tn7-like element transposition protein TnsE [Acinetobacter baumannii]
MKIKNFPEDAKITFLGEIFKFNHLKRWNIKLGIQDGNNLLVKHTRLSNLPALARGRYLNPSDGQCRKGGYKIDLDIESTTDWTVSIDPKNRGYYFSFNFNRGTPKSPNIIHVRIPQIELARVLFFHNAYLARNCIDHGILDREFCINPLDSTTTVIHVLPHCSFPIGQFNNEGIRRLIAWIILDENARQSYNSIARYFTLEAKKFEVKTSWRFHFDLPLLEDIALKTIGYFDAENKEYTVFEITDLHNIKTSLPRQICYESPKFKSGKTSGSNGGSSGLGQDNDEPSVDDDVEADSNSKTTQVKIPQTSLNFADPSETKKVVRKKTRRGSSGQHDATEYEELGVGTDESTVNGNGPKGEFNGLDDDSEVISLYMQRFDAFKVLIEQLASKHDLTYQEKLYYLPKVGRSRLHNTLDGNRRCLLDIQISIHNQRYAILEIDTTDNLRPLSTLILQIHDVAIWNSNFNEIIRKIVKNSLRWPSMETLENFGTPYTLNHPKNLVELTELDNEFNGWLQRLERILNI